MPSGPTRSNTAKKEIQLRAKLQELAHAIRAGAPLDKLTKAAERVRAAQLSLLKARLHWLLEAEIQRSGKFQPATRDRGQFAVLKEAARAWQEKSVESILCEHQKT